MASFPNRLLGVEVGVHKADLANAAMRGIESRGSRLNSLIPLRLVRVLVLGRPVRVAGQKGSMMSFFASGKKAQV